MHSGFDILGAGDCRALSAADTRAWHPPMLATLVHAPFSDGNWLFERKFDGIRCLVYRDDRGAVTLYSRNRKRLDATYPELVEAWRRRATTSLIADGEIVAFRGARSSFSRLQQRAHISDPRQARRSPVRVHFYAFDLLALDGYELLALPLRKRKSLLKRALDFRSPIHFSAHRNEHGERYHAQACRKGWEGLIAKRGDSAYVQGRSHHWRKLKCVNQQELVIGGFTEPTGSREGFGALLLGYYHGTRLVYAGMVGTGFDAQLLQTLHARLRDLEQPGPSFEARELPQKGVHWVQPELVAEIGFTEWTGEGKLRHPSFLGLRDDKQPGDVVKERA